MTKHSSAVIEVAVTLAISESQRLSHVESLLLEGFTELRSQQGKTREAASFCGNQRNRFIPILKASTCFRGSGNGNREGERHPIY